MPPLKDDTPSLSELIRQAQQAQPDHLKPESGVGLEQAAETAREARGRERAAMEQLAQVVREAVDAGMSHREAAKKAGVTRVTVAKWCRQ